MSKGTALKTILALSLAINLFLIGGIAARIMNRPDFNFRPIPPNAGWLLRDLSDERRDELQAVSSQNSEESSTLRREMFSTQRDLNRLLIAEPINRAAVAAAFARLRETNLRYQELSHEQTINIVSQLTPEERQAALRFLDRRFDRDGRNDRNDRSFRDGDRDRPDSNTRP